MPHSVHSIWFQLSPVLDLFVYVIHIKGLKSTDNSYRKPISLLQSITCHITSPDVDENFPPQSEPGRGNNRQIFLLLL